MLVWPCWCLTSAVCPGHSPGAHSKARSVGLAGVDASIGGVCGSASVRGDEVVWEPRHCLSVRLSVSVCLDAASGGSYVLMPGGGETGSQGQVLGTQHLSPAAGGTHTVGMSVYTCVCLP